MHCTYACSVCDVCMCMLTTAAAAATAAARLCCRVPLSRDYVLEHESSLLPRAPAALHPLLSKEAISKLAPPTPSSAAAAYAATAAAPATPVAAAASSAAAFVDPLSVASPRKGAGISSADPLGAMLGAAKAKGEVLDPLRAMASTAGKIDAPKQISKIESVSFGEVKASLEPTSGAVSPTGTVTSIVTGKTVFGPTADCYEPWRDKRASILTKFTTNKRIPVQANFLVSSKPFHSDARHGDSNAERTDATRVE